MGVKVEVDGFITPICNNCGVSLCWSIENNDYKKYEEFWEQWKCEDCGKPEESELPTHAKGDGMGFGLHR